MRLLLLLFVTFSSCLSKVYAQGCTNICPPLNDIGIPQTSLCEGDLTRPEDTIQVFPSCFGALSEFKLSDFIGEGRVTVVSNYYFGCNAGRRESGVFAHVAQRYYDEYGTRVTFIGGGKGTSCEYWADTMASDAVAYYPGSNRPEQMPVVMDDSDNVLRDLLFTPPFGHPSYVIFDGNLEIRHKFVGPCCGIESYFDCSTTLAKTLDDDLTLYINAILNEYNNTNVPSPTISPTISTPTPTGCEVGTWSTWSACSISCGPTNSGIEFRWRIVRDNRMDSWNLEPCPSFVETRSCTPLESVCASECVPEIGSSYERKIIAEGFDDPRDIAFHPTPGYHLGSISEGRSFPVGNLGDGEAWVVNGRNHSVSIVSAVRSEYQTTFSRRDRGYYHYTINATSLSFNSVGNSSRLPERDGFNSWAVCNDNINTYLDTKEPNYFMGPTLYNSLKGSGNLVTADGRECNDVEKCFFLHSDMLHEAPACIGIAHDPETITAFGNVYWAFDATGNQENGQLVRFDFQQPHGPGSMDHSIASVRRYPQVKLYRGEVGVHAGLVVHPTRREVFIANPGNGTIIVVGADTGSLARIAREEYPIYSNALPSFDYSIWECAEQRIFASDLSNPTGMALSNDGERLYVAEYESGKIIVFEVASGTILHTIQTNLTSIQGLAMSPNTDTLYFVDSITNTLNAIEKNEACTYNYTSRLTEEYTSAVNNATQEYEEEVGPGIFSVYHDNNCTVNSVIPNVTYFEQVHNDTGYAGNGTQGLAGMNPYAYLLANRTDCGYDDELNFDSLLLGGFYCHTCLPINNGSMCEDGGTCQNVQWEGYTCDNHFTLNTNSMQLYNDSNVMINRYGIILDPDVTYRFDIIGNKTAYLSRFPVRRGILPYPGNSCGCAQNGPLIFKPSELDTSMGHPNYLFIRTTTARKPLFVMLYIDN